MAPAAHEGDHFFGIQRQVKKRIKRMALENTCTVHRGLDCSAVLPFISGSRDLSVDMSGCGRRGEQHIGCRLLGSGS